MPGEGEGGGGTMPHKALSGSWCMGVVFSEQDGKVQTILLYRSHLPCRELVWIVSAGADSGATSGIGNERAAAVPDDILSSLLLARASANSELAQATAEGDPLN